MLILSMAAGQQQQLKSVTSSRPPLARHDAIVVSDCDVSYVQESLRVTSADGKGQRKPPLPQTFRKRLSRTDCRVLLQGDVSSGSKKMTSQPRRQTQPETAPPIHVEQVQVRRKASRQRTFSGFVQKHLSILKKLPKHSLDSSTQVTTIYSSCPNLVDKVDSPTPAEALRASKSSEGPFSQSPERSPLSSRSAPPKLLTVPNLFTASTSCSKPHAMRSRTDSMGSRDQLTATSRRRQYRHSAPELMAPQLDLTDLEELKPRPVVIGLQKPKPHLKKSYSDAPPLLPKAAAAPPPPPQGSLKDFCNEPRVSKISDLLYIGNLESAHHERLICKLGISSLVDLSNLHPDEVPASKKCSTPCQCDLPLRHTPATLRVSVCESDLIEIQSHLPKINKFIDGAVERGKKVLIVCYSGAGLSVLTVVQYLMQFKEMNLRRAYSQVMRRRSNLELSAVYRDMLMALDRQLYPGEQGHPASPASQCPGAQGMFPKEAWSEC